MEAKPSSSSTLDYKAFIKHLLIQAGVEPSFRESFTDEAGMSIFMKVFTHPNVDPENNYEVLEFIGDGIIKAILGQYIPRRFPEFVGKSVLSKKGTGEGVLSKIRRSLEQRKFLSEIGLDLGFWDYAIVDQETHDKLRKETLEDIFEAFVGALVEVVDSKTKPGIGYFFAYKFVSRELDKREIDISKENLDDPITRLNELYKASELAGGHSPLKWGDAIYKKVRYIVPTFAAAPFTEGALEGTLINVNRLFYVREKEGWKSIMNTGRSEFIIQPHTNPDKTIDKDHNAILWVVDVYGFLGVSAPDMRVNKKAVNDNPEAFGGRIIGRGYSFTDKEAKKMAAKHALNYLASLGISK